MSHKLFRHSIFFQRPRLGFPVAGRRDRGGGLPVWRHGSGVSLFRLQEATQSGQRRRARSPSASAEGQPRANGACASPATGACVFRFEDGEAVDVDLTDYH